MQAMTGWMRVPRLGVHRDASWMLAALARRRARRRGAQVLLPSASAGVVGMAAGATFLIMQKVEADRFNSMCDRDMLSERCAALERSAGQTWSVGSIIGLGLGMGLLSAGAVMFVLDGALPNSQHAETNGCRFGFADIGVSCKLAL